MLEAVNSVLQTAPLARGNSEQVSTVDSFAANPERVQRAPPQAPFISPYIFLDVNFDKAVIQLRNGETGDVIDQFPSEASLEARARQLARQASQPSGAEQQSAPQTRAESAQSASPQGTGGAEVAEASARQAAITAQQAAAFQAAARSGNSNVGSVTLFA